MARHDSPSAAEAAREARGGTPNVPPADRHIETDAPIGGVLPGGKRTVPQTAAGQYQVTIKWTRPGAGATEHNYTTTAFITGN